MQLGQRFDAFAHVAAAEERGEGMKPPCLKLAPATAHQSILPSTAAAVAPRSAPYAAATAAAAGHAVRGDERGGGDSRVVISHHVIVEERELL